MNEILFIFILLLNFVAVTLIYKFFGKIGIFSWIALGSVIINIEVIKCVDIFGLPVTLGNATYGSIFLATDVLSEKYGKKYAQKAVFIGFISLLALTTFTQIDLLFIPNSEDFAQNAMQTIFSITPRICLGSMCAYLVSNLLDVFLYEKIRKSIPNDKFLWIRNNVATMTSQFFDTVIFTFLAFFGIFSIKTLIYLCLTTYIIKFFIAILDTPFLYLIKKIDIED
jgi:hypothetical protein